ncbi:MAG: antA/AntB antirepressor family protein [Verrucomicrobiota bacterium]
MNLESIKINPNAMIGGEAVPAVNLRDIYQALGSNRQFADWAKRRLEETQAEEGADYLLHKFVKQLPSGSKRLTDYLVTLDLAKEIAMLERNEKGKQIRRYFIEVEKEFRSPRDSSSIRIAHLERELAELRARNAWPVVIEGIRPLHEYGSRTKDGRKRVGLRRAAWVARRRCRLEAALQIHKELDILDQAELALGLEGGAL